MKLNLWLNNEMPDIAKSLEGINNIYYFNQKTIGLSGKEKIYKIIHDVRSALFPGVYEKCPIDETRINIFIGNNIREAAIELSGLIEKTLIDICDTEDKETRNCTKCRSRANDITIHLMKKLPEIREKLHMDIQAAYTGDPAALTTEEILLSYPSIDAISIYRIANILYEQKVPIIPRVMSEYAHQRTGIDIHPGAKIGKYFFIDHGTGVVIGETCTIGNNVKIYQGVTLGAKSFQLDEHGNPVKGVKRHPDIEDNVVIYAGATILGGDTVIGHDSIIGGNVWLTHSVPPYSKVYNAQPSPIIKQGKPE
ncbi:MAG TPA: serine acetyltransferase [Clostridiales bacterium]|nr:serine acetyltransferase [Clostridiales bacterium]